MQVHVSMTVLCSEHVSVCDKDLAAGREAKNRTSLID